MSNLIQIEHQIRVSTDYQNNKRILKERMLTDLHVCYNGGMFLATMELMNFLNSNIPDDTVHLLDVYENPIEANKLELLALISAAFKRVMNDWHQQHNELKRIRRL